jgi:hypothetical protein
MIEFESFKDLYVLLNVKNNLENIKLTRVENMVVERQKNA